ncbi:MAG: hypothetical protein ACTSPR_02420 [Candidatus Thorarchaeota archaeon]
MELRTMAETYTIRIRDLPTRKLRKSVRKFLSGEYKVLVEDVFGRTYPVVIRKQRRLLWGDDLHIAIGV